jgi:putative spermidine/putrescine transport system substrate-binding protein
VPTGLLLVAGCGSGGSAADGSAAPGGTAYAGPVGTGEGQLNVLAWPGYAENGSNDPKVDWVNPFTKATGCKVNVKSFATSAEAVQLFNAGGWDVVSASGDASLRLVYGGKVQPVNTALVPNYADIIPELKNQRWNSVGSTLYGIPHGRGANLLLYTKAKFPTAPTSWKDLFDPASPAKGKISPYDDSMAFADAAVYLMATKPELGIKNPYALDAKQFAAVVDLAKQQKTLTAEYWSDYVKEGNALASGTVTEAQGWQITANTANAKSDVVGAVKPTEGSTGWSDTWMVAKDTKNINCAYKWLDWIVSPDVNAQVAEYFGEAPSNAKACEKTADKNHCATYHATDTAYWKDVWYWTTPTEKCLDGRTDTPCVPYEQWVREWSALRA